MCGIQAFAISTKWYKYDDARKKLGADPTKLDLMVDVFLTRKMFMLAEMNE